MQVPMVERRKPLVLYSNRVILDSLLNAAKSVDGVLPEARVRASANYDLEPVRLTAGILRFADNGSGAAAEFNEDSFLVGVSMSTLKKLAVTSGSLVIDCLILIFLNLVFLGENLVILFVWFQLLLFCSMCVVMIDVVVSDV